MNWGYKILSFYALFVVGILFMVFKSSSQNTDLVTTDYYAKELKYQDKIDEQNRVSALTTPINYKLSNDSLIITFPNDFVGKLLTGNIVLYCVSNEKNDTKQLFSVKDKAVEMAIGKVKKGLYQLQISWVADDKSYYFENKIII